MRNQNIIPGRGIEKYAVGSRGKAGEENCSKHLRDSSQFHRPAQKYMLWYLLNHISGAVVTLWTALLAVTRWKIKSNLHGYLTRPQSTISSSSSSSRETVGGGWSEIPPQIQRHVLITIWAEIDDNVYGVWMWLGRNRNKVSIIIYWASWNLSAHRRFPSSEAENIS